MSQLTTCPPATQPADIPVVQCNFDIGQVQKFILQRRLDDSGDRNSLTPAQAALLTNWNGFLTATDSTKAQVTPFVHNPQFEPGDQITHGSGNEVVDGIPLVVGVDPSSFTGELKRQPSSVIEAMQSWEGEDMSVWPIDEHGRIIAEADDSTTPTVVYGIPIREFFVGDRGIGGKVAPDINALKFKLAPRWSTRLVAVTPSDFDALSDLSGS